MKQEYKQALESLVVERNRIEKAINALMQLGAAPEPAQKATPKAQRKRRAYYSIAPDVKAQAYARMNAAEVKSVEAARIANEFGLSVSTIASGWRQWAPKPQPWTENLRTVAEQEAVPA